MKRIIVALMVGGAVFGAVLGLAATMSLQGGAIQQGTDLSLTCQTATVKVDSWGVRSSDGLVTFVQVKDINENQCLNNRLFGRVDDAGGNVLGYTTTLDSGTGGAKTYPDVCVIDSNTADIYDCRKSAGFYKLQLIDTSGNHGIAADQISQLRLWVEGESGS